MKQQLSFLLIILVIALQSGAQGTRVDIPGSEVRKIYSEIVGQEYELHILFPRGFANTTATFPVVYLMDSQWDFPLVKSLVGQQYYDGFIPATLIVGITWGGKQPNADSLRARDYTPTHQNDFPQSGGAPKFLSFLEKELMPFMETNYKADKNNRTLMGCSFGGLFTLYALFAKPGLFQGYVAASPAIGFDNQVIYRFAKEYADKQSAAPARLYMTMGDVERAVPMYKLWESHLTSKKYHQITMTSKVLENTGHSGTKAETYSRGMQYVYERPKLALASTLLDKYAGVYKFSNGRQCELKKAGNALILIASPFDHYFLYAASQTDLYSNAEYLNITMKVNGETVEGFKLERYGGSEFATKVK
jgi:predicted alpha/beta superfamily hydrolase